MRNDLIKAQVGRFGFGLANFVDCNGYRSSNGSSPSSFIGP